MKQPYMGGETFSLIDIFYMPLFDSMSRMDQDDLVAERLHLKAWWERVSSRDSWKSVKRQ